MNGYLYTFRIFIYFQEILYFTHDAQLLKLLSGCAKLFVSGPSDSQVMSKCYDEPHRAHAISLQETRR